MGFWSKLFGKEDKDEKESRLVQISISTKEAEYRPLQNEEIEMAFLVDFVNEKTTNFKPPYYLLSVCNGHINELLKKTCKKGYIRFSTPQEGLNALRIPELKSLLKENELPVSGKKDMLIKRIIASLPEETYRSLVPDLYIATESGKALAASNYVFIHSSNGSDPQFCEKVLEIKARLGCGTAKEDYIKIYNEIYKSDIRVAKRKKNWSDLKKAYAKLSAVLGNDSYPDCDLKKSLRYLLYAIGIDLSGMGNNGFLQSKESVMISPYYITIWNDLPLSISEDKMNLEIDNAIGKILPSLPFSYFSSDAMHTILFDLLHGELEDFGISKIKKYQNLWNEPDPNSTQYTYFSF